MEEGTEREFTGGPIVSEREREGQPDEIARHTSQREFTAA